MRQYALVDICPDVSNAAKKTRVDYEELKHMKMVRSIERMNLKMKDRLRSVRCGVQGKVERNESGGEGREKRGCSSLQVKQIKTEQVTTKQFEEFVHEVGGEEGTSISCVQVCIIQNLKSHPNIVMFIGMSFPPQPLSLITGESPLSMSTDLHQSTARVAVSSST